jgi:hypothetical protein
MLILRIERKKKKKKGEEEEKERRNITRGKLREEFKGREREELETMKCRRETTTTKENGTSWARPSGNFLARSLFDRD